MIIILAKSETFTKIALQLINSKISRTAGDPGRDRIEHAQ
jgi:hypothetical protein